MSGIASGQSPRGLLLILLWDPEETSVTGPIRTRFPALTVVSYCLQTASKSLLEEYKKSRSALRPARYVFTELLSEVRDFDHETVTARSALKDLLQQASVLASLSLLPPSMDYLPNLKLFHVFSAGVDLIVDHPLVSKTNIDITTSKGIHGVPVAEWIVMCIFAFRKKLVLAYDLQDKHEWPIDKSAFSERGSLQGKKAGILGYGSIGRQVARVLSAFGCSIVVSTASPRQNEDSRHDHGYVMPGTGDIEGSIPTEWFSGTDKRSLHHFLSQGLDFLVLSIPLTHTTENMMSTAEFDLLFKHASSSKSRCFLVNVSRGRVIDQPALVDALEDGRLASAVLDVTTPEPLPPDDPLWNAKNLIITPHISTLGPDYLTRATQVLITNLERQEKGEKLFNLFDRKNGY